MNVKLLDLRKKVGFYIQERGGGGALVENFLVLEVIIIMYKWIEFKIRYLTIALEVNLLNIYKLNYAQKNHLEYVNNIIWEYEIFTLYYL
jgi:hypothetical protein